jgi:uncharacterized membrane protein YfcA
MPALLACGLLPQVALGTNKLQSSCGTTLAVLRYARAGFMQAPKLWLAVLAALFASAGGAFAVSALDKALLQKLIPWMLAAVAVYTTLNPRFGLHEGRRKMNWLAFALLFGIALGFYDGFFGPGTGTFWTVACVTLLGLDLRHATAYTKAANLASNVGSLVVFLGNGSVHFEAAGAMIVGQLIGAHTGAGFVVKHGAKFIRPIFLTVVFALTAKLIWDAMR